MTLDATSAQRQPTHHVRDSRYFVVCHLRRTFRPTALPQALGHSILRRTLASVIPVHYRTATLQGKHNPDRHPIIHHMQPLVHPLFFHIHLRRIQTQFQVKLLRLNTQIARIRDADKMCDLSRRLRDSHCRSSLTPVNHSKVLGRCRRIHRLRKPQLQSSLSLPVVGLTMRQLRSQLYRPWDGAKCQRAPLRTLYKLSSRAKALRTAGRNKLTWPKLKRTSIQRFR